MREYQFSTIWRIKAPLQAVWDAIFHPDNWHCWWKSVKQVIEMEKGDVSGVGALHRYTWKGALPYRLTFNMRVLNIQPMLTLEGEASGEVEGKGKWHFTHDGTYTIVRYDWHVRTNTWWMNLLAPLVHPLLRWNHDVVMREGAKGLSHLLGASVEADGHTFVP